ncbi:hypothetical protein KQH61_04670 [bacterium]|nr:hypothetical protein [bacterium]MCB2179198.1 hypothetical protein [bacterium]
MADMQTIQKISHELAQARQAQTSGNQGRARVCARRAAGWAIEAYLRAQGQASPTPNAFKNIQYFATLPGHSEKIKTVLHHLTVKMEKDSEDTEAYYPVAGVDLIDEARWLVEELLQTPLS